MKTVILNIYTYKEYMQLHKLTRYGLSKRLGGLPQNLPGNEEGCVISETPNGGIRSESKKKAVFYRKGAI